MSEMQVPLYTSFKSNNMDIIYFEKNYSLPLTMAPAAEKTIYEFLQDTNTKPSDYDLILTGDLGFTGSQLLYELMETEHGIDLRNQHNDCGLMIYNLEEQDVNSGGSGCGCAGSVLCSHILKRMRKNKLKKVLFMATGALMSPTSSKQGNSIPGIAHAVLLEV
ncbi:MAG: stage V sporulation protein AD [Eubacterium sp.]